MSSLKSKSCVRFSKFWFLLIVDKFFQKHTYKFTPREAVFQTFPKILIQAFQILSLFVLLFHTSVVYFPKDYLHALSSL